jgi:predicted ATPase/DNA-binding SARP family transcriptional activator
MQEAGSLIASAASENPISARLALPEWGFSRSRPMIEPEPGSQAQMSGTVLLPQTNSSNPGFGTAFAGVACEEGTNATASTAATIRNVLTMFIGHLLPGRCCEHDDPAQEPQRATAAHAKSALKEDALWPRDRPWYRDFQERRALLATPLDFRLLGPLEVRDGDRPLALGGRKQRTLLAILLLHANEVVSSDTLIDGLWGERAPKTAGTALQVYVSNLRKLLSADRLETRSPGYLLHVEPEELDIARFERLAAEGNGRDPQAAASALGEGLALWRGQPLADFAYDSFAQGEIARLEELRLNAIEQRIDAELELGRHAELVAELEALVTEQPFRERFRRQLMLALYRCDRQTEALEVYEDARRTMVEELGVEPGAALRELHGSILRQEPALIPRLEPARKTRLPAQPTPFLGRRREVAEVVALLQRYEIRLLTLTGAGGSGKTRLALRVAGEVAGDYPDGVFWVPLASLREPALVSASIAQALSIEDEAELASGIGERRLLLLLDNFEHVVKAAPKLSELLSVCPNLNMLATSREPLHLAGEREYVVPTLADEEAVELFHQRAHVSEPEEAVLAICRRLDCLPLAVELAAARTKLLPPEALLQRLEQRLPLLVGGPRDAPERQRTLEATIAWSYDLLNENEQRLLTHLTVFAGGCTLDAAEQVCQADLDTVQALVDKNLLRREGERYYMLATIREYATEHLARADDEGEYERRHARHYLERAYELYDQGSFFEPDLDRRDAAQAWFTAERENLRAAFAFFTARGDRQAQLDLGGAADAIWSAGRVAEGRRVLAQLLEQTTGEESEARRRTLMTASWLAWRQGDMEEGLRLAEEALALARSAGDARQVAAGLMRVQTCAGELGELDRARAAAQEGERRARELELKLMVFGFMANRGNLEALQGNLAEARKVFHQGLALLVESGGSRPQRAHILFNLGLIAVEEGEAAEASALFDEAVDLLREHRDLPEYDQYVAVAVEGLASIAVGQGEPDAAARLLGAAHAWRQLDDIRLAEWEQRIHNRTLAAVQAQLGTDDFTSEFTAGRKLTLDEAVECAHAIDLAPAEVE